MGRIKKYLTESEVKEAKSQATKRWYYRNKETVDKKARDRYHINKLKNHGQSS
jgi:hypothetical protein